MSTLPSCRAAKILLRYVGMLQMEPASVRLSGRVRDAGGVSAV